MMILLEVLSLAALAIAVSKLAPEPWRGRGLSTLKAWFTVRAFWLLLTHPIAMEDGTLVPAGTVILQQLAEIDAATFWTWVFVAFVIKCLGMLASMYRWVLVLRGQGIELPFRHIFGSFMIGRAIGTFLPSTAGLDGYTLYDASRFSGRTVEATAAKFLEKICGLSGVFMTFLVALPFGVGIFGENAALVAGVTIPVALAVIGALLIALWFPSVIQWALENLPIPAKDRLHGIVMRISNSAAAYRDQKPLILTVLFLSFMVHFTTAAMYYFTGLAIGAEGATFWQVTFGSSIQIFATVVSPFTIAGEGIREAAQMLVLGSLIGPAAAIVAAALGFWTAEAPTMIGFVIWWLRDKDYTPAYCRVNGVQVDYEEAARAAVALETEEQKAEREARGAATGDVPSLPARIWTSAGVGLGSGILAGIVIGVVESGIIAQGGFGQEAQVWWYAPLAYSAVLGGLALLGGVFLGTLPMRTDEARSWTPTLGFTACLVPLGLAITLFRLRRDVYLEQMPPVGVLLGVLAAAAILALVLLVVGRWFFASRAGAIARPLPALGLLAGVCGIGWVLSLGTSPTPPPAARTEVPAALADRPNVILVMVDTLRADHLSCYGASQVQTPNLCSLAEGGGSRLDAFAHASWTKPSTATLLTSLVPSTHKAMSKPSTLSPDLDMLSEAMKDAGYATGGVVSNINLASSFGFDQGYDEYHYLAPDYIAGARESSSKLILYQIARSVWFKVKPGLRFGDFYQDSAVVNEVAFDWLSRHRDDRFFLFLHYMDPHDPYFEHPYDGQGIARISNQWPDETLADEMRRLYRGEIEYLDHNFGKLLAEIDRLGLTDSTAIVLTADHGEEFLEHGGWWHGLTLYDEQIRVPLLVKWAGTAESPPESEIVRHIDVAPTLIRLAGGNVPSAMQGIDLATSSDARKTKDRQVFSEEDHEGNVLWSLRTRDMKLISANSGNERGLPERAFFDVADDPGERHNLEADGNGNSARASQLEEYADLYRRSLEGQGPDAGADIQMTMQECLQLKNLGYIEDCSQLQQ